MKKTIYCCDYCEKEFNNENDFNNHVDGCLNNPKNTMDIWKYKFEFNFNSGKSKYEEIFLSKVRFEKIGSETIFINTSPDVPEGMEMQKEYYTDFVRSTLLGHIFVERFSVSTIISLAVYSDKKLNEKEIKKEFLKKISKRISDDIEELELKKYEIDCMIEDK